MSFEQPKYKIETFDDAINAMKCAQKMIADSSKYFQKIDPEVLKEQRNHNVEKPVTIEIKWYLDICSKLFSAFLEGNHGLEDDLFSGRCAFNEFIRINNDQYGFKNKLKIDSKIADNVYDKLIEDPFNGKDPLEEYPGLYICIKDDIVYMHYTNESRNPHIVNSVKIDMIDMEDALKNAYEAKFAIKKDRRKANTILNSIENYIRWYKITQNK